MLLLSCFFFFQAEDGIRDYKVTGVQTCALPISCHPRCGRCASTRWKACDPSECGLRIAWTADCLTRSIHHIRSEERRVGKECSSRWSRGGEKEKARNMTTRESSKRKAHTNQLRW